MYPLPPSFPSEEVGVLLGVLRGSGSLADIKDQQAAWVLVGWGIKELHAGNSSTAAVAADHGALAAHLDAGLLNGGKGINWGSVLSMLWPLIEPALEKIIQGVISGAAAAGS